MTASSSVSICAESECSHPHEKNLFGTNCFLHLYAYKYNFCLVGGPDHSCRHPAHTLLVLDLFVFRVVVGAPDLLMFDPLQCCCSPGVVEYK